MGVKGAKTKKARSIVKRDLKASERCHHCKQMVHDLEQHIRTEHTFACARCGQRFAAERPWKQHMRDRHGLVETEAIKDDRKNKIDKWIKGSKANGSTDVFEREMAQPDREGDDDDAMKTQSPFAASRPGTNGHRHVCELCDAEHILPVDLGAQGLSFQCSLAGQRCGSPATMQTTPASVPASTAMSVPGFISSTSAALAGQFLASSQSALLGNNSSVGASTSFGSAAAHAYSMQTGSAAAPFGVASAIELAAAAATALPDDGDDDDL